MKFALEISMVATRSKKRKFDAFDTGPAASVKRVRRTQMKVVSWNLQGGGKDAEKGSELRYYMNNADIDAICLQECGRLFGWVDNDLPDDWEIAIHRSWDAGGGNPRCSLAILARGGATHTKTTEANWTAGRPIIGARILGGVWVWCVHAPQRNPHYVLSAVKAAKLDSFSTDRWICAGDFNLEPGLAIPYGNAVISNCNQETHQSGRELDYAFISNNIVTRQNAQRGRALISDHWPVTFWLTLG